MEPHRPAVDHLFGDEGRRAMDLGAEAEFGQLLRPRHAGAGVVKAGGDLLGGVPDRRDNAHAGDDDAFHPNFSMIARLGGLDFQAEAGVAGLNRPTRMSLTS